MGKWVDNRASEIEDLVWDGIDTILSETVPVLDAETGAFDGSMSYKNTVRGRLHKRLHDEIWPNIEKQLDSVEEEINECVDKEVNKILVTEGNRFDNRERKLFDETEKLRERIEELEEENRLFREGKAGMVHGKQYGI